MLLLKYASIFFWNALEKKKIFLNVFFFFFLDFFALIEMVGLIFYFFFQFCFAD